MLWEKKYQAKTCEVSARVHVCRQLFANINIARNSISSISCNTLCVSLFRVLARAIVENVSGSTCQLCLIDSGHPLVTSVDNLLAIKPKWAEFPAQAISCCLVGQSAEQGSKHFNSMSNAQTLFVKVGYVIYTYHHNHP